MRKLSAILTAIAIIEILLLFVKAISPAAFVLLALLNVLILLVRDIYPPVLVLFAGIVQVLIGSNSIDEKFYSPELAFSGFSNASIITVGALFLIAKAVRNSGLLDGFGVSFLGNGNDKKSVVKTLAKISLPLSSVSAFFNNTPVVAIFLPTIREWAEKHKISPSKLLLPLSYFTIFGGACTLIGTSTNLVIDGFYFKEFGEHLSFFSFAALGIPAGIIGTFYLLTAGHRLLPEQKGLFADVQGKVKKYLVEMTVDADAPFVGKSIEEIGFRDIEELFLFKVRRNGRIFAPVKKEFIIEGNDVLIFSGQRDGVLELQKIKGLSAPSHPEKLETGDDAQFVEVVISASSPLIGRTINDLWFNRRYNATVLALHRNGSEVESHFSSLPLKSGDTLLLLASTGFRRMWQNSTDFLLVSPIRHDIFETEHRFVVLVSLIGMILLPALGILPISITSITTVVIFTLLDLIKPKSVLNGINWDVLLVIGAAFGISEALKVSGAAELLVNILETAVGNSSPQVALIIIALTTSLTSEFVTNNAAAALIFPVAVQFASSLGVNPLPFVMVLAIGASASFSTPVGYQTNTMVYGPGGYKYLDYVKVGLPLNLIFTIIPALIAPIIWPF